MPITAKHDDSTINIVDLSWLLLLLLFGRRRTVWVIRCFVGLLACVWSACNAVFKYTAKLLEPTDLYSDHTHTISGIRCIQITADEWDLAAVRVVKWDTMIFFSKMVAGRHLGSDTPGNSTNRSADPENPILEPNMKWIGWSIAEIWRGSWTGGHLGRHLEFLKMLKGDQSPPSGF